MRCDTGVIAKVYTNNGITLTENSTWQSNLTGVGHSSLDLGDIDNDGDLDLALSGCDNASDMVTCNGNYYSKIYLNNGTALVENQIWQQNLTGVFIGSLAFGDMNNDGKLDLVSTGKKSDGNMMAKIYINNGTTLTENSIWQQNLIGIRSSMISLGDIDNDGDLDLDFGGYDGSSWLARIYANNGTSLVESSQWEQNFGNWGWPENIFGDIDNDGDLDLIKTGTLTGDHLWIYNNNGSTFSVLQKNSGDGGSLGGGLYDASLAFADIDNDGDLDFATMGRESGRNEIYNNNQSDSYNFSIDSISGGDFKDDDTHDGSLTWLDLDNDTDVDLIVFGTNTALGLLAKVYISNASLTKNNTKPSPPNSSFSSSYVNNILALSWGNGSDTETNVSGLYYNLMVGNSTKNNTIVSGVYGGSSNPTAGYFGNMMQRKSIALNVQLEANKTYYWYVQTIDTGLMKSNWSALQTFNTSLDVTKPNITINEPSPNASLHTTNPYFIFNTTVTDANLTNVTLNANWTGSWHVNQSNSSGINGTYTFSVNLTNNVDGHYAWYIGANDSSNNSETSGIRDFYLDRAYPIVRLISPANSASWTSSSTVTFTYNVSDVDVSNCSLFIDGNVVNASNSITESAQQNFTYFLSNGNYNWQVNCTDYVGFTNSSETRSLSVSYTAPSSGSSGGRGGGIAVTTKTYTLTNEQLLQGYTQILSKNDKIKFLIANENHSLMLDNLNTNLSYANLTLNSTPLNFLIYINEEKKFELTNDNYYDLSVKLNFINNDKANLTIKAINEKVNETRIEEEKEAVKESKEVEKEKGELAEEKLEKLWLWIIGLVAVIILLIMSLRRYIKYRQWKRYALIG